MNKRTLIIMGSIVILASLFLLSQPRSLREHREERVQIQKNTAPTISFGDTHISLIGIQDTPEKRMQGLSGRPALGAYEGMLFIFPEEGIYSFWMKDMLFPIDIIWLSSNLSVVHIAKHVNPASYPDLFTPPSAAQYVLEVPAGFADKHAIDLGSHALRSY